MSRRYKDGEHVARVGFSTEPDLPKFGPNGPWLGDLVMQQAPSQVLGAIALPDPIGFQLNGDSRRWAVLGRDSFTCVAGVQLATRWIGLRIVADLTVAPANVAGSEIVGVNFTTANAGDGVTVLFTGTIALWAVGAAPVLAGDKLTTDATGRAIVATPANCLAAPGPVAASIANALCLAGAPAGGECLVILDKWIVPGTVV